MQLTPEEERLWQIFHPFAAAQQSAVLSNNTRFVHYTRAEVAKNILKEREVWMRKSIGMNDFMEVQYGMACLKAAYQSGAADKFKITLDELFKGLRPEIEKLFDDWTKHILLDTYFTCISEHLPAEDITGRLSMWRAYGGTNGVALVMKNGPFTTPSHALKAYASPVAYLSMEKFAIEFARIGNGMAASVDFLKQQGREEIKNRVFNMLRFAAVCTKHPGFAEEREWRVVYSPILAKSEHLIHDIQVIQGAPQPIYKIPLKDIPEEGLNGIEIPALLDRIIIGPSKYPLAIWEAFRDLLAERGVENPHTKVFVSDIPLRQ